MTATAVALLGYAAWSLLLVSAIAAQRTAAVLRGRPDGNRFATDGSDVSPFAERLARVHANCYESLPAFGAIALVSIVTGNSAITDPLALWVLAARVGQSITHLASTAPVAINVRFAFFLAQVFIQVKWLIELIRIAA